MFTVPVPGGLVTVICVLESAVTFPAAPPKLTPVAPPRLVPVIVTAVPPPVVPLDADTLATAGCFACEPEPEPDEPEPDDEVPEDEVPDVDPPDEPEEDEPVECA